ncbi:Multidrug resistance protein MdtA [Candidatus Terasakiella magnetica]|nr:Multidrug resistance protein MdtA [Candidatus Terasakiella magnetica]
MRFPIMKKDGGGRGVILAVLLAAGVIGAYAVWPAPQAGKPGGFKQGGADGRPVPVSAVQVMRKDVPIYLDALGTVQAYNTVTVRSRVDGELVEVLFKEGQDVHAGDVLAQIDPRTYRAQYEQSLAARDKDAAQLEAAKRDLSRYVGLGDRVSGQSVDTQRALVRQLEASVRADEANISNAKTMLSYTVITAPIDGRTGMRLVDRGNIVRASDAAGLVTLTQVQPIAVMFTLPQQNLPAINDHMRDEGKLTVQATRPETREIIDQGELELVDNQIDQTTGTIRMKAVLPNAERRLWPGGFVSVRLLLTTRLNGLVIPAVAVQRGPQGPYVFTVKPDRTVEMRPVKIATVEGDLALLESGLEESETVVTEGMIKLQNGSRVSTGEGQGQAQGQGPQGQGQAKGGKDGGKGRRDKGS